MTSGMPLNALQHLSCLRRSTDERAVHAADYPRTQGSPELHRRNTRRHTVSWEYGCFFVALLVLTCTGHASARTARAPIFVTKKAAMTQEYMLLSTYINPASEAYHSPEVVESHDGALDITCEWLLRGCRGDGSGVEWSAANRRAFAPSLSLFVERFMLCDHFVC